MSLFIEHLKFCIDLAPDEAKARLGEFYPYHVNGSLQQVISILEYYKCLRHNPVKGIPERMHRITQLENLLSSTDPCQQGLISRKICVYQRLSAIERNERVGKFESMKNHLQNKLRNIIRIETLKVQKLCHPYVGYLIVAPKPVRSEPKIKLEDVAHYKHLMDMLAHLENQNEKVDIFPLLEDGDASNRNIKNLLIAKFGSTCAAPLTTITYFRACIDEVEKTNKVQVNPGSDVSVADVMTTLQNEYSVNIKPCVKMLDNLTKIENESGYYLGNDLAAIHESTDILRKVADDITRFIRSDCCNCWKECKPENETYAFGRENSPCQRHTYCENCRYLCEYGCPLCGYEIDLQLAQFKNDDIQYTELDCVDIKTSENVNEEERDV